MRRVSGQSALLVALVCWRCGCGAASAKSDEDDGALYLTPMIRAGRLDEARAACAVKPAIGAVESCAGYLTVDETHGSNLFFWFYPAMNGAPDAPVLLWLQGGPGASSMYAVFNEHGPFSVRKGSKGQALDTRNHTWVATHSVLYVDNPVGTGYSFTGDEAGYSADQTSVAQNVYEALVQFFTLFAEHRANEFYVTGESYAGKYVPAVSYAVHLNNPGARVKINLKGLAIGNGMVDPVNQLVYSEYLYQHGFVDEDGLNKIRELENTAREQIAAGNFKEAAKTFDDLVYDDVNYPYPSLFNNLTGMRFYFNMLWDRDPVPFGDWTEYVQQSHVRSALHVGRRPLNNASAVARHLVDDIMRPTSEWLAALLDAGQYRVLLYSGQLDIIVPYRGTMRMAQSLRWSGAEQFRKNSTRTVWREPADRVGNATPRVAGYSTALGPLTVLLVRDAGHMVPTDQPVWSLDLINRFTSGKPF